MRPLRIWIVGLGTVGQWLLRALEMHADRLRGCYGISTQVVGVADARDGLVYRPSGVDVPSLLALKSSAKSIAELAGIERFPVALEGLRATEADLLVEVTASPASDGEPGLSHIREALARGIPVVTSNKWPVALKGLELAALARSRRVAFRAESTVMSGTPVLSTLVEGLAGADPVALRGVLNATANFILSRMAEGVPYSEALAEAQSAGLAEREPTADVDGHDTVAKVMILSALVFGREVAREEVLCRGITGLESEMADAAATGKRLKHVATIGFSEGDEAGAPPARVRPEALSPEDPLAQIERTMNAVVCTMNPVGEVTIMGPGAGPQLAGQGVLSDLIAVARQAG